MNATLTAVGALARRREGQLALMIAAVAAVVGSVNPAFLHADNLRDMLVNCAPGAIVACGMALVIATGEIDISVGSLMGLLAAVAGLLSAPAHAGLPVPLAAAITLALGAAVGCVNGLLVTVARVPSIIVTLGMLTALRGVTELLLGGEWVTGLPAGLRVLGIGTVAGVPVPVAAALGVVGAALLLTRCMPLGRRIYAVGSSAAAAAQAGLPARRIKLATFTITGLLTAVATLVSAPQLTVIESGTGVGFELFVITCVVVGGTSISGGTGTIPGAMLGVILLGTVRSVLLFMRLGDTATYWERAIQGAFILAAVLADHLQARRGDSPAPPAPVAPPAARFPFWHEAVLAGLFAALMAAAAFQEPRFVSWPAQVELSGHLWELALLTLPMTFIIITAGIDLSVGSAMALSAVVLGLTYRAGAPVWAAAGAAMATGLAAGALNGLFVARVRVHPLIATLATLAVFRGVAEGVSLGEPVSGFPEAFALLGRGSLWGLPIPGLLFAACTLVAAVTLAWTPLGRSLYAIGHNETACRFSGLRVDRIKMLLYTLSGGMAALAAVLFVARRNTAKADVAAGMELEVITAVVLGGTSIFGGRGRVAGTLLGVLLIHEMREFVSWRWNKDELIPLVMGVLLILSVLFHRILSRPASGPGPEQLQVQGERE